MSRSRTLKATVGVGLVGVAMIPMAVAWACTSLATMDLAPGAANSGQTVAGKGYGFSGAKRGGVTSSAVDIHFQRADGPILATVRPDGDGNITFRFTAPAGAPGYYTIIATQTTSDGSPVAGTPARATLALNNPPPLAADSAGVAATTDIHSAGQAPSAVTHIQAPAAAPTGGAAAPAASKAPAQVLPPIPPSGARARDILGSASRDAGVGGQLGLTMAVIGGLGLVGAAGTALLVRRSQGTQRI